jgi:anthranilate synthase component 1
MHIEYFSHVMHIVSHVSGELRDDKSSFDAFRSIFPAGTVSGAPKIKAIQLVAETEKQFRRLYAGAVGNFSFTGDIDTAIAIRTILFKDGVAYFQAGAGIVFDSIPELEYEETINKLYANIQAVENAERKYMKTNK